MSQMTLNRIKSKQTLNLQFYKAEKLQRSNNKLKINKDSYTVIDIIYKEIEIEKIFEGKF